MSVRQLIQAIATGDSVAIQNTFESEMMSRVAERLDAKRQEVARNMFNTESVELDEAEHVIPYNTKASLDGKERYKHVMAHAKKMGYNVHHNEHYTDEKSGNKGTPDVTIHYERGDNRHDSSPASIEIHKGGKGAKDKTLIALAKGKASAMKEGIELDEATVGANHLHVQPVKKDGKTMYHVHAVGKNFADGIKAGEHLSDSELDDAAEMGAKIKHIK